MKKKYVIILFILLTSIIFAQSYYSDSYWLFNKKASVSEPEKIATIKINVGFSYDVYRIFDWQTGKEIVIVVNPSRWDVSPSVAISSLEHK